MHLTLCYSIRVTGRVALSAERSQSPLYRHANRQGCLRPSTRQCSQALEQLAIETPLVTNSARLGQCHDIDVVTV